MRALLSTTALFTTGAALLALTAGSAFGQTPGDTVGSTAAVNPATRGTPPAAETRVLVLGEPVYFEEHISTDANGQAQILFLDQSALTVGPNSDLVIDRFVYNPSDGTGELSIGLSRGAARLLGGQLGETGRIDVSTPIATIGLRGTSGIVEHDPNAETTTVVCLVPLCGVVADDGTEIVQLIGPGDYVVIGPNGEILEQGTVTPEMLAYYNDLFDGEAGETGGTPNPPQETDPLIVGLDDQWEDAEGAIPGVGGVVTGQTPPDDPPTDLPDDADNVAQDSSPPPEEAPPPSFFLPFLGSYTASPAHPVLSAEVFPDETVGDVPGAARVDFTIDNGDGTTSIVTLPYLASGNVFPITDSGTVTPQGPVSGNALIDVDETYFFYFLRETSQVGDDARQFLVGGVPFDTTQAPNLPLLMEYDIVRDLSEDLGVANPLLLAGGGANEQQFLSPLYSVRDPIFSEGDRRLGQAWLGINGAGPSQTIVFGGLVGTHDIEGDGETVANTLQSWYHRNEPSAYGGGEGDYEEDYDQTLARTSGRADLIPANGGIEAGEGGEATNYDTYFYGDDRPSAGFIGGRAYADLGFAADPADPDLTLRDGTGGSTSYEPYVPILENPDAGPEGSRTEELRLMTGYAVGAGQVSTSWGDTPILFSTDLEEDGVSIYTDGSSSRAGAHFRLRQVSHYGQKTADFFFGDLSEEQTIADGQSAFIDDDRFVMLDARNSNDGGPTSGIGGQDAVSQGGLLASSAIVGTDQPGSLPGEVNPCQDCEFTEWGWWAYEVTVEGGEGQGVKTYEIPIGTYVVGTLADPSEMPGSGEATYSGHVLANIVNNGAMYVAASQFGLTYDFGDRDGTMDIESLDGVHYNGDVDAQENFRDYSGWLHGYEEGNEGTYKARVDGSFFQNPAGTELRDEVIETGGQILIRGPYGSDYRGAGTFQGAMQGDINLNQDP